MVRRTPITTMLFALLAIPLSATPAAADAFEGTGGPYVACLPSLAEAGDAAVGEGCATVVFKHVVTDCSDATGSWFCHVKYVLHLTVEGVAVCGQGSSVVTESALACSIGAPGEASGTGEESIEVPVGQEMVTRKIVGNVVAYYGLSGYRHKLVPWEYSYVVPGETIWLAANFQEPPVKANPLVRIA